MLCDTMWNADFFLQHTLVDQQLTQVPAIPGCKSQPSDPKRLVPHTSRSSTCVTDCGCKSAPLTNDQSALDLPPRPTAAGVKTHTTGPTPRSLAIRSVVSYDVFLKRSVDVFDRMSSSRSGPTQAAKTSEVAARSLSDTPRQSNDKMRLMGDRLRNSSLPRPSPSCSTQIAPSAGGAVIGGAITAATEDEDPDDKASC